MCVDSFYAYLMDKRHYQTKQKTNTNETASSSTKKKAGLKFRCSHNVCSKFVKLNPLVIPAFCKWSKLCCFVSLAFISVLRLCMVYVYTYLLLTEVFVFVILDPFLYNA